MGYNNANCHTNWDKLTPAQQKAAIQKGYMATKAKFDAAVIAHQRRVAAMQQDFNNTLMQTARDMNCNKPCIDNCSGQAMQQVPDCVSKCQCFNGVIKITPAHANYREVVEEQYGDLENLTVDDYTNIFDSIEKSQMLM